MKVYIDGVLYEDDNMLDWQKTSTIPLSSTTKVMAIECVDIGSNEGIIASTNDGMMTDGSWKCSPEAVEGWTLPDFDDSAWGAPTLIGANGVRPWGNRPDISEAAQWIWPEGGEALAYCRKSRIVDKVLTATCDDTMTVYLDGTKVPEDEQMSQWNQVSTVIIPSETVVLAIQCHNTGGPEGIVSSTDDGILTDASWKCSGEEQDGWTNPDFDDSAWEPAAVLRESDVEGVAPDAQWIWSTDGQSDAFCRKLLRIPDTSVGKLEVVTVDVETGVEESVLSIEGNHGNQWNPLAVDMPPNNRLSAIRLKGVIGSDNSVHYGDIALDDVLVRNGYCFEPSTTAPATPTTTAIHDPNIECDFETDMCKWDPQTAWVLSTGTDADHTTREPSGQFAAVDFASLTFGTKAKLQLMEPFQIRNDDDTHCFQFYYKLDSAIWTSLTLNLQTTEEHENNHEGNPHWTDGGARGQEWILGQYEVNRERAEFGTNYFLLFTASQEFGSRSIEENLGIVYLDDITFTTGECPTLDVCTFESKDLCKWHPEDEEASSWTRVSSQDTVCTDCPDRDHTYHTQQGHYMALRTDSQEGTAEIRSLLISPTLEPHEEDWGLKLFFEPYDLNENQFQFNIYVRFPGQSLADLTPLLAITHRVYPNQWMPLYVPLPAANKETEVC